MPKRVCRLRKWPASGEAQSQSFLMYTETGVMDAEYSTPTVEIPTLSECSCAMPPGMVGWSSSSGAGWFRSLVWAWSMATRYASGSCVGATGTGRLASRVLRRAFGSGKPAGVISMSGSLYSLHDARVSCEVAVCDEQARLLSECRFRRQRTCCPCIRWTSDLPADLKYLRLLRSSATCSLEIPTLQLDNPVVAALTRSGGGILQRKSCWVRCCHRSWLCLGSPVSHGASLTVSLSLASLVLTVPRSSTLSQWKPGWVWGNLHLWI